ncbi:hypothetical protein C2E21_3103 [Chlorella sorokiniana]|uniref:Uncharacterized protein n=1 Tax=Chlorella sorokiniana TaxID=3076 RepID=A0A2P6TVJ6_CHLSO|nr:hypothetical protein C2E21_3103 [Chlorella sorokiniana]|eukprot:PRW58090.1 hypothetical protein C2E21_3103 [Chlorella sorokiniana]
MDLSFAPSSVKESLEARDEAAEMKCVQMFDCDGDRREYAKQQWADFVARGGVPERKTAAVAANEPGSGAATDAAAGSD